MLKHSHILLTPPLTPSSSIQTEPDSLSDSSDSPGRFLIIENVPPHADADAIKSAFTSLLHSQKDDPIKGIFVRFRASHGLIIIAFFDSRHALKVANAATGLVADRLFLLLGGNPDHLPASRLKSRFISVPQLASMIGHSAFVDQTSATFCLALDDPTENPRKLDLENLRTLLQSYGDLSSLKTLHDQVFQVAYYDVRDANAAFTALNGQVVFGLKLRSFDRPDSPDSDTKNSIPFPTIDTPPPPHNLSFFDDTLPKLRPRSVSAGHNDLSSLPTPSTANFTHPHFRNKSSANSPAFPSFPPTLAGATQQLHDVHGRRHSNQLFFDAVGKTQAHVEEQKHLKKNLSIDLQLDPAISPRDKPAEDGENDDDDDDGWMGPDNPDSLPRSPHHPQPPYYLSPPPPSPLPAQDINLVGRAMTTFPYYNLNSILPTTFYPPQQPSPTLHFPLSPSSPPAGFIRYDYDANPTGVNLNWPTPFDHPIIMTPNNPNPTTNANLTVATQAMSIAPPASVGVVGQEYWYPNGLGQGIPGAYYPPTHHPLQISPPTPHPYTHPHPHYPLHTPQALQDPYNTPTEPHPYFTFPPAATHAPISSSSSPLSSPSAYAPLHINPPLPGRERERKGDPSLVLSSPSRDQQAAITMGSAGTSASSHHHNNSNNNHNVPAERNQLNLARIEDGQDTRTTVMIKNIPNKMSDKDLVAYIGKVCPRKIDFLYLRMDFQNGCNVGYAFVNFIRVQDLLTFAKARLGVKWNMFSSEKVLQMSYANYQGKEALVEKFKNSCIMDEREAWRPKIFHSDPGPNQGFPEPFPAPTHLRRKERSSYNRGALFFPGSTAHSGGGGGGGGGGGPGGHHLHHHPQNQNHNQHNYTHHHHDHTGHNVNSSNGLLQVQPYRRHQQHHNHQHVSPPSLGRYGGGDGGLTHQGQDREEEPCASGQAQGRVDHLAFSQFRRPSGNGNGPSAGLDRANNSTLSPSSTGQGYATATAAASTSASPAPASAAAPAAAPAAAAVAAVLPAAEPATCGGSKRYFLPR